MTVRCSYLFFFTYELLGKMSCMVENKLYLTAGEHYLADNTCVMVFTRSCVTFIQISMTADRLILTQMLSRLLRSCLHLRGFLSHLSSHLCQRVTAWHNLTADISDMTAIESRLTRMEFELTGTGFTRAIH